MRSALVLVAGIVSALSFAVAQGPPPFTSPLHARISLKLSSDWYDWELWLDPGLGSRLETRLRQYNGPSGRLRWESNSTRIALLPERYDRSVFEVFRTSVSPEPQCSRDRGATAEGEYNSQRAGAGTVLAETRDQQCSGWNMTVNDVEYGRPVAQYTTTCSPSNPVNLTLFYELEMVNGGGVLLGGYMSSRNVFKHDYEVTQWEAVEDPGALTFDPSCPQPTSPPPLSHTLHARILASYDDAVVGPTNVSIELWSLLMTAGRKDTVVATRSGKSERSMSAFLQGRHTGVALLVSDRSCKVQPSASDILLQLHYDLDSRVK
eukprot:m51a1_g14250 hypothetical protein (320) ;mRNA; r:261984-264739